MDTDQQPDHEERWRRFRRESPPRWWPEGEAWPPSGPPGGGHWQGMRGRFLRRIGCAFAALLLVISGLTALFLWFLSRISAVPLSNSLPILILIGGIGLLAIILVGSAFRRTVIPFSNLLDAAGRIAGGDYAARVPVRGPGEVRGLARAFNSMAERLETNDRQRRAMLADVTHELRTPITILQGQLEGMLDGIYPADDEHLKSLLDETQVLSRMIDDLRTLTLAEAGALKLVLETVDLAALVEETAAAFRPQAGRRSVSLHTTAQPNLPTVEIDATRIREVLANLLSNAIRYTPPGGSVQVRVEGQAGAACVSVQDSGAGIAAHDLPHIFDRFYKSADSRGSGLGLAIAKNLVTAHGGEISAESTPGQGTTVRFTLPGSGKRADEQ